MAMKVRNIRTEEQLWDAASEKAKGQGTDLSKLIRQWLTDYNAGDEALAPRDEGIPALLDQMAQLVDALRVEALAGAGKE
jgi:hypothetical protein